MGEKIMGYIKFINQLKKISNIKHEKVNAKYNSKSINKNKENTIYKDIISNINFLKTTLGKSNDVIFREFKIGSDKQTKALICFIDGLADKQVVTDHVIKPMLLYMKPLGIENPRKTNNIISLLKDDLLSILDSREVIYLDMMVEGILCGEVALIIDNCSTALLMDSKEWATRAISQPDTEVTVRGSREGFTETLRTNTSLLRRIIKSPNLVFETMKLGSETNTKICIVYIQGIVNLKIVEEVKKRLNKIDTDSILESGYIEQFIEDNPLSVFATVGNSERPDKIAAKLLEGRVAIICEGTPFVLSVPYLFIEGFQVNEDYYSKPFLVSLIRLARILSFIITLTVPALYIALETFHQEMIPTVLILTAASAREGTPFPTFVEVAITEILFLLLRESGIRMPRPIGQTVSFIGALVIGESAVNAGIISAPMVIIGALTAITSFIIPSLYDSIVFFRYLLIVLSATFGMHGIILGLFFMIAHMCSLRSFGTPYLQPLSPATWSELKDSIVRFPLWLMDLRPRSITNKITRKQSSSMMPKKTKNNTGSE
jgi:spore germination protein KA